MYKYLTNIKSILRTLISIKKGYSISDDEWIELEYEYIKKNPGCYSSILDKIELLEKSNIDINIDKIILDNLKIK